MHTVIKETVKKPCIRLNAQHYLKDQEDEEKVTTPWETMQQVIFQENKLHSNEQNKNDQKF